MNQRRDRGAGLAAVACRVLVGIGEHALKERVAHRLLHQQARACQADLPRVVVLAGGLAGGGIEVGVGEHDEGALAAELRREGHDVAGGGRRRSAGPPRASR